LKVEERVVVKVVVRVVVMVVVMVKERVHSRQLHTHVLAVSTPSHREGVETLC